jgi:lipid A 3-O-deacylase
LFAAIIFVQFAHGATANEASRSELNFDSSRDPLWNGEVGDGFRKHAKEVGVDVGAGFGLRIFGGREAHDIALGDVHAGLMLTGPVATNHWFRGNLELLGQFFGGEQFNHHTAYVVGLAPLLRYNFATGSKFVPFIGGGAGPALTEIRHPDLSTRFEFNVQAQAGLHWFVKRNVSVTAEYRWLHLSNAGIERPNQGVNTSLFLVGVNWFL